MAKKKGGLGRGLGELFDEITEAYENELPTDHGVETIPVVEIRANPYQPRKVFDESAIKELSQSIKQHGLLQPIVVVQEMDGYVLVAGERRLRASKLAGIDHIKAVVVDIELDKFHELALIENIQRENLNPIELATAYDLLLKEHDLTHEELSLKVQKSRAQITNTLRLLALHEKAKEALVEGKISQGHAKIIVSLDAKDQEMMVHSIIGQKLSVREAEQMVKEIKKGMEFEPKNETPKSKSATLNYDRLKTVLDETGFEYKITAQGLNILFKSQEEVDEFINLVKF